MIFINVRADRQHIRKSECFLVEHMQEQRAGLWMDSYKASP